MNTTGKFHRIVVATSGSPGSKLAVQRGVELAAHEGAEVVFVHVRPPVQWRMSRLTPVTAVPRLLGEPEQDEALQEAQAKAREAGVKARIRLLSGDTAKLIKATADNVAADLIVLGPTGRNPLREHAGPKVRRLAKRSVLIAKQREHAAPRVALRRAA